MSEADAALARAEELLERLRATREELEKLASANEPDAAIDVLIELAELAKEVEAELQKARARADAGA
jgi:hypothetical protein